MCGIAGIVSARPGLGPIVDSMVDRLAHRGPDDRGTAVLEGAAMGMRRLSIIDLASGHQPMWNEDGSVCVVFNGEIYNFAALRRELTGAGHRFTSDHSDTEVLVHGYEEWGEELPSRLDGMFAFAIWDLSHRRLFFARDRFGEKPFYYARFAGGVAFASEIKALLVCPGVSRQVDLTGLSQYLAFDYAIAPRTPVFGVQKLPAGHMGFVGSGDVKTQRFWAPSFSTHSGREGDLLAELDRRLDEAVRTRMTSDVPLGLFLSGGLDSSTVGYYMRRHEQHVRSFSIGFEESAYDESTYAAIAARALGTDHHTEVLSQTRVRDLLPEISSVLDEPMGDQSILPTLLLCATTRQHVKVALGGDGSDELLMGYKAFKAMKVAWSIPKPVRGLVGPAARTLVRPPRSYDRGFAFACALDRQPGERILAHLGAYKGDGEWLLTRDARAEIDREATASKLLAPLRRVGAPDATTGAYLRAYLQDDILTKVDRASMAASLEVRAPFLAPVVADFALGLPTRLKLHGLTGKWLLRRLMRGRIPDVLIDRPKMGFGMPLDEWLRKSLAPLVTDVLSPDSLARRGVFEARAVERLVREHMSGSRDHGRRVWLLVQFELWAQRWLDESTVTPEAIRQQVPGR